MRLLTHLIIFLGIFSLLGFPGISETTVFLLLVLLIPSMFTGETPGRGYSVGWRVGLGLFALFCVIGIIVFPHRVLHTLLYLLAFGQIFLAFNPGKRSTAFAHWFFTLLMLAIVSARGQTLFLLPVMVIFLTLSSVLLLRENLTPRDSQSVQTEGTRPSWGKGYFIVPAMLHLLLSWAIFFLILGVGIYPLSPSPLTLREKRAALLFSNLTTELNFGEVRTLLRDPTPALKLAISTEGKENVEFPLYLKATTLNQFDGLAWGNTAAARHPLTSWQTPVDPTEPSTEQANVIKQEIQYLQAPQELVVYLPEPVHVVGLGRPLVRLACGSIIPEKRRITSYVVYSIQNRFDKKMPEPEETKVSEHLQSIVEQLLSQIPVESEDRSKQAESIQRYLQANYVYSLEGRKRVEHFLENQKWGHCEHFATAMCLLLRGAGIPARLAVGFLVESQPEGKELLVRRHDAHTWVEAYFADQGWVSYDPTPPPPLKVFGTRQPLKWLLTAVGHLREGVDAVFYYPQEVLRRNFGDLSLRIRRYVEVRVHWDFWKRSLISLREPEVAKYVLLILLVDVVIVWLYLKLRRVMPWLWMRSRLRKGEEQRRQLYRMILRRLGRRVEEHPRGWTPAEFLRAGYRGSNPAALEELLALYYGIRFGGHVFGLQEAREFYLLLESL